ncbi:hypothetical protein [Fibrella aquatilis]|uniref:Uncharacterized protein n=1 Tax=Fibrella aquatilis TaxID=2817059 RepID=A0A939G8Q3_9BACT|nr:hypothetical protein [Fibrella aquatilis]MBO0933916.1 hypothetical protein [Fibrella aquatilis]
MPAPAIRVIRVSKQEFIERQKAGELPGDDQFQHYIEYEVNPVLQELSDAEHEITNYLHTIASEKEDTVHYFSVFYIDRSF